MADEQSARRILLAEMSQEEESNANRAVLHLVGAVRVLFQSRTPALALAVATADALAEAGTYLIALDLQTNGSTDQSRQALRDVMRILGEFFDRQAAGVQFEAIPRPEGPVH